VIEAIPPGLLLILGGLLLPVVPERHRKAVMVCVPLLGLGLLGLTPLGTELTYSLFDYELTLTRVDSLSRIFGVIFHLAAALCAVYAWHDKDLLQQVAAMTYAGAAIAATFAGDLITLFVFWEGTAITSVFLIWARRTERAYRSGMRYLVIQVASGVLLLSGAIVWYSSTGSLEITGWTRDGDHLRGMFAFDSLESAHPAALLVLLSFGIKAAFPLLHNWLQDAYPEATVTGTVWLSSFTTKLAIYALARCFAGTELLIPIGATMTAFPIFYAVIENDLRRVLAYSLNNQLGYMVVGVGIGTELALNGTAGHAFAHILYKGLLFMGMGAVIHRVGHCDGSDLGGLWRKMPLTTLFTTIGAMAISAFPLFSGFVTKSMILSAAAIEHHTVTFGVLLFASAGVFHHSGIKIPFFAFFAHEREYDREITEAPKNMLIAMGIAAFLCIFIGCVPAPLYALLPFDMEHLHWIPYDITHVVTMMQLLLFSALAFVFLQKFGLYPPELRSTNVDFDWVYRKGGKRAVVGLGRLADSVYAGARDRLYLEAGSVSRRIRSYHSPGGPLGEPWPIGSAAIAAAVILVIFLAMGWMG